MSYASRALALASALLMGAPAALAHTNSIGYVGNGTGGVTFWYGSWHGGTTFNEGELKLEGANGTTFNPTITQFTIINNATPNGLVPGTNYFQSDGTALVGYQSSPGVGNGESYTWQGVTFNSLAAGDYTFTYIPLGNAESYQPNGSPTMDWMPFDQITLSSTVTLSAALISGDANQNGILDILEGTNPVTPTTPTVVSSNTVNNVVTSVAVLAPVTQVTVVHTPTENDGVQKINRHVRTDVTTTSVTTTTTTPVTTDTYSDGSTVATNGTAVVTTSQASPVATSHAYTDYFGRVDQLAVLDGINDGINGLLNHEPSRTKEKFRVFQKNRYVQSKNGDGYSADSKIIGGGFEVDLSKGWTVGYQYNDVNIDLVGRDSISSQEKKVHGLFSTLYGNTVTLNTNAAMADSTYKVGRTVENIFSNAGETKGDEWWVSNKLYWNLSKAFKPYVGHTVSNVKRDAYTETGSVQSARSVAAYDKTTNVGEVGLNLETRFGGKNKDLFGLSADASYATDDTYLITTALDINEVIFVEVSHGKNDGVTNNSISGNIKFRF